MEKTEEKKEGTGFALNLGSTSTEKPAEEKKEGTGFALNFGAAATAKPAEEKKEGTGFSFNFGSTPAAAKPALEGAWPKNLTFLLWMGIKRLKKRPVCR